MAPHVHGVLPSLAAPPPDVLSSLIQRHDESSQYSLLLTAHLMKLLRLFDSAGVPVITLKGPVLSQQLYGDPGVRASVDLDLLVPPDSVERAVRVLEAQGYALESSLAWLGVNRLTGRCTELTLRGPDGTGVDLHWASAPVDHPCQIRPDRLWSSIVSVPLAGRSVPALAPECLLLYLCIHGARHCWTKLRWLCDVAMLVSNDRTLNWEFVRRIAEESRAVHALHLALHLAHTLLRTELPAGVLAEVEKDTVISGPAHEATAYLTADEPQPQPSSVRRTMFNARLAETRWLGLRHIAALMKAPTEADAARLRLPRQLFFLYYPFRAARLAAKYST
jgi:hypothetical protein